MSLFNGRDLTGWGYRPTSEEDKANAARWQASDPNAAAWPFVTEPVRFDGRTSTPDGRFVAIDGRLVVTTPPEYRKIQQLWTTREFPEDFVLKLEFRATPNADSGVYLRGPQLQCRDYRLAGPYKSLERYRPQDWNELVVDGPRRRGPRRVQRRSARRGARAARVRPDRRGRRPRARWSTAGSGSRSCPDSPPATPPITAAATVQRAQAIRMG